MRLLPLEVAPDTAARLEVVTDSVPEPELTAELVEDTAESTLEQPALRLPLNWRTLQASPEARMESSYYIYYQGPF